jgi:hypothetical protein
MVLLLAVSVPMLRPMLESQKTSQAAQVLAGAFRHARTKAIHEKRGYGISLIPFATAPTTAVQLRLQKSGIAFTDVVNPPDVRVKVKDGMIIPYRFTAGVWQQVDWTELDANVFQDFEAGCKIQFNRLGRSLKYKKEGDGFQLESPYDSLTLPEDDDDDDAINDAMEYRISKKGDGVSFAWLPPVVMPRGTIVDIAFSGGEDKIPITFSPGDEVVVMFSPAGYVDQLYVINKGEWREYKVNEMLYFCVGDWDRQVDAVGNTLAEDKKPNIEVPATYWVTLHPKTGGVRIAENAPIPSGSSDPIRDARRFAREHFFDVGGN